MHVLKKLLSYRLLAIAFLMALVSSCQNTVPPPPENTSESLVQYPEKGSMILLTDRPPQLETPLEVFKQDITPNDLFFVRWHLADIVTRINIDTFRLRISGSVAQPLALSMDDLRSSFPPDSIIALTICAGNSRSTFTPAVPGSQWKNGAMGNAKWKGVRLRDILTRAGIDKNAFDVVFKGMDKGTLPSIPVFEKSIGLSQSVIDEILIAYEMNGQPIPMLNGYPLKLVVPGWYATYWVSALGNIEVVSQPFKGFWMEKAYRIASNPAMDEQPGNLAKETVPLTTITLHSIFVTPAATDVVAAGKPYTVEGLVFNDGSGIEKVAFSADGGSTWLPATLNPEIGKYSWRRWKYTWTPTAAGNYDICIRATDSKGNTQPEKQWNRSGYARGFIEHLQVNVK